MPHLRKAPNILPSIAEKPREFQLYSLENVWFEGSIECFADKSEREDVVLIVPSHVDVESKDQAQDFGGERIHCGIRGVDRGYGVFWM